MKKKSQTSTENKMIPNLSKFSRTLLTPDKQNSIIKNRFEQYLRPLNCEVKQHSSIELLGKETKLPGKMGVNNKS